MSNRFTEMDESELGRALDDLAIDLANLQIDGDPDNEWNQIVHDLDIARSEMGKRQNERISYDDPIR